MKNIGFSSFGLLTAVVLSVGCRVDDDDPTAMTSMTAGSANTSNGDEEAEGSTGGGNTDPSADDPMSTTSATMGGADASSGGGETENSTGEEDPYPEACRADCTHGLECGTLDDEEACLTECGDSFGDLTAECGAAFGSWLQCEATLECEQFDGCDAEADAIYEVCEPSAEVDMACTAYCEAIAECAPELLFGTVAECIQECGVDNVLAPPVCDAAEIELIECHAAQECAEWEAFWEAGSPCEVEEEALGAMQCL